MWQAAGHGTQQQMKNMSGPRVPLCFLKSPVRSVMPPGDQGPGSWAQGSLWLIAILHLLGSDRLMPILLQQTCKYSFISSAFGLFEAFLSAATITCSTRDGSDTRSENDSLLN